MINKVILIGRLGKDPELKYSQSGMPVTSLTVATDESYMDRDGNRVDRTEWHRVSVFQKAAENCAQYLSKGSLVYVEGKLATRKWQDQQGNDRYSTDIVANTIKFLSNKDEKSKTGKNSQKQAKTEEEQQHYPPSEMDDCPF